MIRTAGNAFGFTEAEFTADLDGVADGMDKMENLDGAKDEAGVLYVRSSSPPRDESIWASFASL